MTRDDADDERKTEALEHAVASPWFHDVAQIREKCLIGMPM